MNLRLGDGGYVLKLDVAEVNDLKAGKTCAITVSTVPAFTVSVIPGAETGLITAEDGLQLQLTATDVDDLLQLGSNRDGILLDNDGWQMRLQIDIRSTRPKRERAKMSGDRDKGHGFRRSAGAVSPTAPQRRR